ncbi:MAG TPA: sigma 54-interacting transcriptional regulator [Kiritimatiellia bacterium]|nr:sigma 54-interacting transcriptional regulator [Kiritimatiellia bacterium]
MLLKLKHPMPPSPIQALRYEPGGGLTQIAVVGETWLTGPFPQPHVLVVPLNDCSALLKRHGARLLDRGAKHHALAPYPRLRRQPSAALLRGASYSDASQCLRSIRTLLDQAGAQGDRNCFVIGVPEPIFRALRLRASTAKETTTRTLAARPEPLDPRIAVGVGTFLGRSAAAATVRTALLRTAGRRRTVLLAGEHGTGKDFVARLIHDLNAGASFVHLSCATARGHDLRHALQRAGWFERDHSRKLPVVKEPDRYTLYLDEVSDLGPADQVVLRQALRDGDGGVEPKPRRGRLVASTSRDLCALAADGRFDWDLYYRLIEFVIHLPTLRTRTEDVPELAQALWRRVAGDAAPPLPARLVDALRSQRWAGNLRELKSVLARLHATWGARRLSPAHLAVVLADHGRVGELPGRTQEDALRAETLQSLRRASELLRAAAETLQSLTAHRAERDPRDIRERLSRLGAELDAVCAHPLSLGSHSVFVLTTHALASLRDLVALLSDRTPRTHRFLRARALPAVRDAQAALFEEIRRRMRI